MQINAVHSPDTTAHEYESRLTSMHIGRRYMFIHSSLLRESIYKETANDCYKLVRAYKTVLVLIFLRR